jgi:aspartyl-tRNA synthetase
MPVFGEQDYPEEIRLKYRFLDLRREEMHKNIILRSKVISFIRSEMLKLGFLRISNSYFNFFKPRRRKRFFSSKQIKSRKILCTYLKLHNNLNN